MSSVGATRQECNYTGWELRNRGIAHPVFSVVRDSPIHATLVNKQCLEYHANSSPKHKYVAMVGEYLQNNSIAGRSEPSVDEAAALMRAVADKDRRAFEAVYYIYSPRLGRYLMRLLKRREVVDEVLNDVMLVVWQSAPRYDPTLARLSTWLFGIAHNKALKALSNIARQWVEAVPDSNESTDFAADFDSADSFDPTARSDPHNPEQTLIGRQLGSALQKAVDALSPDHRAVVELAFAEDYSYQEIATALACPVNTVKTRMFYARKHLAELLTVDDHGARKTTRSQTI
jgi:RNA polymerase sigma-70 factor, ECF subfamily